VPVYPVKGRVSFTGRPLAGALVVFERREGSVQGGVTVPTRSTGRTDQTGEFQLMTYQGNDGAPAGEYLVGILATSPRSEGNLFALDKASIGKGSPDVLRGRYSDPKQSGLQAVVKPERNEIPPFELR
jgi:hypothetical protein